ncbi:MAG: periplasmic heavy metal sensor [Spirochaetia bacterium]|nr:periplasmic heavy metal sensor [Spirochaetia bacterium]
MHVNGMYGKGMMVAAALLAAPALLAAQTRPVGGSELPAQYRAAEYGVAEARRDFRLLALTDEEAARIVELAGNGAKELERARAEIRELQARLARLLLEDEPDRAEVEKTVRASLEAEYRVRMIQIERGLAIRALLGPERWGVLNRLARGVAAISKAGDLRELAERVGDAEKLRVLAGVLRLIQ